MVPSLPPLRAIRSEQRGDPQPVRQTSDAPVAPVVYQQPPRVAPVRAALPQPQRPHAVPAIRPSDEDAHVAWRRVKTEADGDAYELHHQQLQSMAQHFVLERHPQHSQHARTTSGGTSSHSSSVYRPHPHAAFLNNSNRFSPSDNDDVGDDDATGGQQQGGEQFPASERFTMAQMRTTSAEASWRSSLSSSDHGGALTTNDDNENDEQFDPSMSKKERRKEQCRVNQANYRKRKRMYENELSGQIKLLEEEILELKARKIALHHQPEPAYDDDHAVKYPNHRQQLTIRDPIQSISNFYYVLESAQLEPPVTSELRYPGLHALFELQQQEFASIDAFQLQWLWYREQFAVFQLLVSSSERLDAGDQVIIRISAQLHIQMQQVNDDQRRRPNFYNHQQHKREASEDHENQWFARKLVCPVLQQFEFHAHERVLTQITSEIDWLAGVAAVAQSPPEHTLLLLREFANEVATSGYYNSTCC